MLPRISEASVSRPAGDKPRRSLVSVENAIQESLIWPEKVGRKPEPRSKSSSTGSLFRDVKVEAADGIGGVFDTVDTYQHVVFPRLEDAARQRGLTGARKTGWESSVTPSSKPVPLVPPSPIDAAEIHAAKSKLDHLWLVSAVDHQARVEAAYKSKPKRGHKAKAGGKKSASKAVSGNVAVGSRILETLARVEAREHMVWLDECCLNGFQTATGFFTYWFPCFSVAGCLENPSFLSEVLVENTILEAIRPVCRGNRKNSGVMRLIPSLALLVVSPTCTDLCSML
jgi:hypothetical protein